MEPSAVPDDDGWIWRDSAFSEESGRPNKKWPSGMDEFSRLSTLRPSNPDTAKPSGTCTINAPQGAEDTQSKVVISSPDPNVWDWERKADGSPRWCTLKTNRAAEQASITILLRQDQVSGKILLLPAFPRVDGEDTRYQDHKARSKIFAHVTKSLVTMNLPACRKLRTQRTQSQEALDGLWFYRACNSLRRDCGLLGYDFREALDQEGTEVGTGLHYSDPSAIILQRVDNTHTLGWKAAQRLRAYIEAETEDAPTGTSSNVTETSAAESRGGA